MRPEMPFLAAGGVVLAGGAIKNHGVPDNAVQSIMGTIVLTVVASATAGSRVAPVVHAIGLLLLLGAVLKATNNVKPAVKSVLPGSNKTAILEKQTDWINR